MIIICGPWASADDGVSVVPALYLKSDIELEGQGTGKQKEPFTITNYLE